MRLEEWAQGGESAGEGRSWRQKTACEKACRPLMWPLGGDGGAAKTKLERQDPAGHGGLRSQRGIKSLPTGQ